MKRHYFGFTFAGLMMVACGHDGALVEDEATEQSANELTNPPPRREEEHIPIVIENPDANQGLTNSGNYFIGWQSAFSQPGGYWYLGISYDSTLNSNVFNVVTYDQGAPSPSGYYPMAQGLYFEDQSAAVRNAIADGYPVQCEWKWRVEYEQADPDYNLKGIVATSADGFTTMDSCETRITTRNSWRTGTCGPVATVGTQSLVLGFKCKNSDHCKMDQVRCYVVKREGFQRFQPVELPGGFRGISSVF